jgi:phosphatidylserine/phosphatidylglycerophosphate/cardiolipin synthase-like enzyme
MALRRLALRVFDSSRCKSVVICTAFAFGLAGCASLPTHVDRVPSQAKDGSGTALGAIVNRVLPGDPLLTVSGFRLLPTGAYALDARMALAERAERTLDVQYYLIANDSTGKQFLAALRDAAKRGVRVRLLLDDFYTAGEDGFLSGLADYPNVEIRLFNPLPAGRGMMATRILSSLGDLPRINRRMHNKLFIADNRISISGGRNIADGYFTHSGTDSFLDLDLLSAGPVVKTLSAVFDTYWNSDVVYPFKSIVEPPADHAAARAAFDTDVADAATPAPLASTDALGHRPVSSDLQSGDMELHQAIAQVLADPPQKAMGLDADTIQGTVSWHVDDAFGAAKSELLIVSPYFVPGKLGMREIRDAVARGVKVTVVTNSLAATDVPLVYVGYRRDRLELLKLGVKIYELSEAEVSEHVRLGDFRSQLGHLHIKTVVIDGHLVFVGSMNMDERSAHENTETGVILESQTFASEVKNLIDGHITARSYEVRLQDGHLIWVINTEGQEKVLTDEPDVSMFEKIYLDVLAPFAPEKLL